MAMWQSGNAFSETPIAPLPHFDNAFSETPIAPLPAENPIAPLPGNVATLPRRPMLLPHMQRRIHRRRFIDTDEFVKLVLTIMSNSLCCQYFNIDDNRDARAICDNFNCNFDCNFECIDGSHNCHKSARQSKMSVHQSKMSENDTNIEKMSKYV